jgi:hypothetical protein
MNGVSDPIFSFIVGIFFGFLIYYEAQKNRLYEYIILIWPPSVYCWLIGTNLDNEISDNEKHHAIIVIATDLRTKFANCFSGVSTLLISFTFQNPRIAHKLYFCSNEGDVRNVIENPNATHVWIFGHGLKHGVTTGKNVLYYCEVKNIPQKEFIGQYHCNHGGGKSLADYNHPKICDVTDSFRSNGEIEQGVRRSLESLKITPKSLTLLIFIDAIKRWCNIKSV